MASHSLIAFGSSSTSSIPSSSSSSSSTSGSTASSRIKSFFLSRSSKHLSRTSSERDPNKIDVDFEWIVATTFVPHASVDLDEESRWTCSSRPPPPPYSAASGLVEGIEEDLVIVEVVDAKTKKREQKKRQRDEEARRKPQEMVEADQRIDAALTGLGL
ncbi:hypothetical protein JCM10212_000532 [Sporobolomyces blumeae]